jgi:hypothetical protein
MAEDSKTKLLRFLDRKVFNPVLKARPDKYSETDQKTLDRLKRKTADEQQRYRTYKSAGQIRQEFEDDLDSAAAKKVHANLRKLKLPALPDVRDEFLKLADRVGATPERKERRRHRPHAPHPWHKKKAEDKEKAWRELKKQARKGNKAAKETLRKAPKKAAKKSK